MTLTRPNSFFDWSVNLFEISTYLASLARAILNTYVSPGKATCKAFWQGHQTRMCSIRLMAGIRCSRAGKANPSARCMNGTLPCGRGPAFRAASQTDTGLRGALGGTRTLGRPGSELPKGRYGGGLRDAGRAERAPPYVLLRERATALRHSPPRPTPGGWLLPSAPPRPSSQRPPVPSEEHPSALPPCSPNPCSPRPERHASPESRSHDGWRAKGFGQPGVFGGETAGEEGS